MVYDHFSWICGDEVKNTEFCWPCLAMGDRQKARLFFIEIYCKAVDIFYVFESPELKEQPSYSFSETNSMGYGITLATNRCKKPHWHPSDAKHGNRSMYHYIVKIMHVSIFKKERF